MVGCVVFAKAVLERLASITSSPCRNAIISCSRPFPLPLRGPAGERQQRWRSVPVRRLPMAYGGCFNGSAYATMETYFGAATFDPAQTTLTRSAPRRSRPRRLIGHPRAHIGTSRSPRASSGWRSPYRHCPAATPAAWWSPLPTAAQSFGQRCLKCRPPRRVEGGVDAGRAGLSRRWTLQRSEGVALCSEQARRVSSACCTFHGAK